MKTIEKAFCLLISITLICSCVFAEDISEFDETVYVATLDSMSGEELLAYIDSNKEYSGIAEYKAYKEIIENGELFTNAVREYALDIISSTDMSNMVLAETNRIIEDALLVAALSYSESYGMLNELIHMFAEEIGMAGGDINGYNMCAEQLEIAKELCLMQPYARLEEFVIRLNMLVEELKHGSASGPSYGGGGNTIGGGTSSSSYVVQWELSDEGVLYIGGTLTGSYSKTSQIPWYGERLAVNEIVIGENITHIGDKAFYGCINVQKITIPECVTSIGTDAFKNCDEMTICGEEGSYAQVYADENQIPFIANIKPWDEKYMTVDFAANSVKWYFDVNVHDFSDAATVFAAVYDADGRLLSIDSEDLVTDDITSLSIAKNSNAMYAQIFVWNKLLKPITKTERFDL